jgi:RNA polymerase-interacting CarD/CdnL/TRCF family regulator
METSHSHPNLSATQSSTPFQVGDHVIYGMHGRCSIVRIDHKTVGGQTLSFYVLEAVKPPLTRSTKKEPAIFVPIQSAQSQGMRRPITNETIATVTNILESREYYFSAQLPWNVVLPQLNQCLVSEGAIGLAKVASYVHVRCKKYAVPPTELQKYSEQIFRLLNKEIGEALGLVSREAEELITKALRHKSHPDH